MTPADLKALLAELALPQRQLAFRLGVAPNTVHRWCLAPGKPQSIPVPEYAIAYLNLLKDNSKKPRKTRAKKS